MRTCLVQYEAAKQKVSDFITDRFDDRDDLVIIDDKIIETEFGWVFPYNSKKFLETGQLIYALAGNAPIIFDNRDETIHIAGTAHDVEHYVDIHRKNYVPAFHGSPGRFRERPLPCTLVELGKESHNLLKIVFSIEEKISVFIVELYSDGGISLPGALEDVITASLPRSHHFGKILEAFLTGLTVEFPVLLSDSNDFP